MKVQKFKNKKYLEKNASDSSILGFNIRGFSTLEIMIAFAIITLVLAGVVLANFGAQYWSITAETSNEALYKAKINLEYMRETAKENFYQATSTVLQKSVDSSCQSGGLCYFAQNIVSDISPCSKYASAYVSWQVPGYPTSTTVIASSLTSPTEAVALGGDCILDQAARSVTDEANAWKSTDTFNYKGFTGNPTSIDVLNGIAYITTDQVSPEASLQMIDYKNTSLSDANAFTDGDASFNDIDIARDLSTGRTYAFVARNASTSQLDVFDVTSTSTPPRLQTDFSLSNVDSTSAYPEGWRVFYYGQRLYMTTRKNDSSDPEFHVLDVSNPLGPYELTNQKLDTTVNDMVVRNQYSVGTSNTGSACKSDGGTCRFAYLATSDAVDSTYGDDRRLMILDVTGTTTTPIDISALGNLLPQDSGCSSASQPKADSLFISGNLLYIGLNQPSCATGANLYVLDISDPYVGIHVVGSAKVVGSIVGIRVLGNFMFIETSQVLSPSSTKLLDIDHEYAPAPLDRDYLYVVSHEAGQVLHVWNSAPANLHEISYDTVASDSFDLLYNP